MDQKLTWYVERAVEAREVLVRFQPDPPNNGVMTWASGMFCKHHSEGSIPSSSTNMSLWC